MAEQTVEGKTGAMIKIIKLALVSIIFWTAIALICAAPHVGTQNVAKDFTFSDLTRWWAWGVLTPGILAFDYFLPFSQTRILPRLLVHLCLGAVVTIAYWYLTGILNAIFGAAPWADIFAQGSMQVAVHKMFWNMVIYCLIVGFWQAYLHRQQFASAELQMARLRQNFSEARLNILRMQLDPHFLFNALNTVSSELERDPKLARKMIEHLGDLLRLSLNSQGSQEIHLSEELKFLDHYLAIQRIRFGDRLTIVVNVDAALKSVLVPSLFIQPLVENAIRHGISKKIDGGSITLNARQADGQIVVEILDDGVGLPADWSMENQTGIGLAVTRERFAGLYAQGQVRFDVRRRPAGGTEVSIAFPLRTRKDANSECVH
jgi:two-component system LytT family sensor kinase